MPQKQNPCGLRVLSSSGSQEASFFKRNFELDFFSKILNKVFLTYHQLDKALRYMEFTREMLKDQLYCLKTLYLNFVKT